MAYQFFALNSIEDIPQSLVTFVGNHMTGWTAAMSATPGPEGEVQALIDMPASAAGDPAVQFTAQALNGATVTTTGEPKIIDNRFELQFSHPGGVVNTRVYSPVVATGTAEANMAPRQASGLRLFGQPGDAGYIAGVVEYGTNRYRHFWFGRIAKRGGYLGGHAITSTFYAYSTAFSNAAPIHYNNQAHRGLFSGTYDTAGYWDRWTTANGGVFIDHPTDPANVKLFTQNDDNLHSTAGDNTTVIGGFRDGPADALIFHGGSTPPTQRRVMVPIELFIPLPPGASGLNSFRPIGYPNGVRVMLMEGLSPGDIITVGAEQWMVFPEARASSATVPQKAINPYMVEEETTWFVAYAYQV